MPTRQPTDPLHPPFTDEQMQYLWERDIRLSTHGTAWSRKHIRSYARRATVAFTVLALAIGGAFYSSSHDSGTSRHAIVQSGRVVSVDGCNRDFKAREVLRGLLLQAQKLSTQQFKAGRMTAEDFAVAQKYYADQLAAAAPLDCRPSALIITDDPSRLPAVPAPLHPRDPVFNGPH